MRSVATAVLLFALTGHAVKGQMQSRLPGWKEFIASTLLSDHNRHENNTWTLFNVTHCEMRMIFNEPTYAILEMPSKSATECIRNLTSVVNESLSDRIRFTMTRDKLTANFSCLPSSRIWMDSESLSHLESEAWHMEPQDLCRTVGCFVCDLTALRYHKFKFATHWLDLLMSCTERIDDSICKVPPKPPQAACSECAEFCVSTVLVGVILGPYAALTLGAGFGIGYLIASLLPRTKPMATNTPLPERAPRIPYGNGFKAASKQPSTSECSDSYAK